MLRSLKSKLAYQMVVLGIIPLVLSGVLGRAIHEDALIKVAKQNLMELPRPAGRRIGSILYFSWNDIQIVSHLPLFREETDNEKKSEFFLQRLFLYSPYAWMAATDQNGVVIASSDSQKIGRNHADAEWFRQAKSISYEDWNTRERSVITRDVIVDQEHEGIPVIEFITPIYDMNRNFIGVIYSDVRVDYLAEHIKNIKIGDTGGALLLRRDGVIIADPKGERKVLDHNVSHLRAFQLASQGKTGVIREKDHLGRDSFISYMPMGGYKHYPGLNWVLLTMESADEVLATSRYLTKVFFLIITSGVGLILVGGYFLLDRGISKPISDLTQGAREIGGGNLRRRITIHSSNEIGTLADTINRMAGSLEARIRETEESERKYRSLFENAIDSILILDAEGNFIDCNQSAERLLAYGKEDLLKMNLSHIDAGDHRLSDIFKSQVRSGRSISTGEHEILNSRGRVLTIEANSVPLFDDDGNVIAIQAIIRDVTESKRARMEIRYLKEFNENIVRSIPIGLMTLDPQGKITYLNSAIRRLFSEEDTVEIGFNLLGYKGFMEQGEFHSASKRALNEGVPFELYQYPHESPSGNGRFSNIKGVPLQNQKGEIDGLLLLVEDVSEKVKLQHQVVEEKEFSQLILNRTPTGICVCDDDMRITYANSQMIKYTGGKDPVGTDLSSIFPPALVEKAGLVSEANQILEDYDVRLEREPVGERIVNLKYIHLPRRPAQIMLMIEDITEQKELERRLIHSNRLAALGELAGGIAHEINNPTGIILAKAKFLQAIKDKPDFQDKLERDLPKISSQAERIQSITKGLLSFSRFSSGERSPTDFNLVIEASLLLVEHQLEKKNIKLQKSLASGLPPVMGNQNELQQVILNLLNNAVDSMPDGGILTVKTDKVSGKRRGGPQDERGLVEAIVADTGRGMPPEIQERVFNPFFTTKEVGEGTGLGLSVSYGIVKDHGGELSLESKPGRGSRFRLRLPAAPKKGGDPK